MKWWKHIFSISDNKALSARHAVEYRLRAVCVRGGQKGAAPCGAAPGMSWTWAAGKFYLPSPRQ